MEVTRMLTPFPEAGTVEVSAALAGELLKSAECLPLYDNREFYSTALQTRVHDDIRESCPESFDWLVDEITKRVVQWPYCVLVRGMLFDEGNRLFVAVNRAFGELVALPYQEPRAQLVHYIQPATDIPSPRGGQEVERLHTDATDWETPIELISMVCVRADPRGGGQSRVLDVDTIRAEVRSRLGDETIERLESEPVPWKLSPHWGGGLKWRTVLTESGMCWRRYSIDLALESKRALLSKEMMTLLDAFEGVLETNARTLGFLMRAGELLFSDNTRTIHARTPITVGSASDRLMLRSWIRTS
jgi:Taurine catabolism dioxygenase TauD, TfdA family